MHDEKKGLFLECKVDLTFKQSTNFDRLKEIFSLRSPYLYWERRRVFLRTISNLFMVQGGTHVVEMAVSN